MNAAGQPFLLRHHKVVVSVLTGAVLVLGAVAAADDPDQGGPTPIEEFDEFEFEEVPEFELPPPPEVEVIEPPAIEPVPPPTFEAPTIPPPPEVESPTDPFTEPG